MTDKGCKIDAESHPIDGWRFIAKGDKQKCSKKLEALLEHSGPYNKKFVSEDGITLRNSLIPNKNKLTPLQ